METAGPIELINVALVALVLLMFEIVIEGVPVVVEHIFAPRGREHLRPHMRLFDAHIMPALFLALSAQALHNFAG